MNDDLTYRIVAPVASADVGWHISERWPQRHIHQITPAIQRNEDFDDDDKVHAYFGTRYGQSQRLQPDEQEICHNSRSFVKDDDVCYSGPALSNEERHETKEQYTKASDTIAATTTTHNTSYHSGFGMSIGV